MSKIDMIIVCSQSRMMIKQYIGYFRATCLLKGIFDESRPTLKTRIEH